MKAMQQIGKTILPFLAGYLDEWNLCLSGIEPLTAVGAVDPPAARGLPDAGPVRGGEEELPRVAVVPLRVRVGALRREEADAPAHAALNAALGVDRVPRAVLGKGSAECRRCRVSLVAFQKCKQKRIQDPGRSRRLMTLFLGQRGTSWKPVAGHPLAWWSAQGQCCVGSRHGVQLLLECLVYFLFS